MIKSSLPLSSTYTQWLIHLLIRIIVNVRVNIENTTTVIQKGQRVSPHFQSLNGYKPYILHKTYAASKTKNISNTRAIYAWFNSYFGFETSAVLSLLMFCVFQNPYDYIKEKRNIGSIKSVVTSFKLNKGDCICTDLN